jgi:hypothetical protein
MDGRLHTSSVIIKGLTDLCMFSKLIFVTMRNFETISCSRITQESVDGIHRIEKVLWT